MSADTAFAEASTATFDPNASIGVPTGDMDGFADLVEGGDEEQQARIREEMKTSSFGAIDVRDFTDFNAHDVVPDVGEYVFSVEQKFLKEATSVTRLTTAARGSFGAAKITLFKNKLRMATFNQSAFSEIMIPLHDAIAGWEEGKEISFIFDHAVLAKIASTFVDAIITFKFVADKSLLIIQSGKTRLELSTFPKTEFTDYHAKLGEPSYISQLRPASMRRGIQYASTFVKKDDIQLNLSLIDIREGMVLGGSYSSIGIFQSKELQGTDVKVKYEIISILEKILGKFHENNTHLFETENYYVIRDENLYVGFEKTEFKFPPVTAFLSIPTEDYVLVPRSQLLNSLYKLSVVSVDRDLLVHVRVEGSGAETTMTLSTKDSSGKLSQDVLQVFRAAHEGKKSEFSDWDAHINIAAFIKVVSHFESANAHIEMLAKKAIALKDEGEEFKAMTVLSLLTEDQVAAQKARKEAA